MNALMHRRLSALSVSNGGSLSASAVDEFESEVLDVGNLTDKDAFGIQVIDFGYIPLQDLDDIDFVKDREKIDARVFGIFQVISKSNQDDSQGFMGRHGMSDGQGWIHFLEVMAIRDYDAQQKDQLSVKKGECILVDKLPSKEDLFVLARHKDSPLAPGLVPVSALNFTSSEKPQPPD